MMILSRPVLWCFFTQVVNIWRYLRDSLHFVDKRRVAVWGWSYGGFVAAHALSHPGQDVFHCGISVAPVVSWRLYGNLFMFTFIRWFTSCPPQESQSSRLSSHVTFFWWYFGSAVIYACWTENNFYLISKVLLGIKTWWKYLKNRDLKCKVASWNTKC